MGAKLRLRWHSWSAPPSPGPTGPAMLVVTSDVADEIHLHGYDKAKDVAAGGTIRIPFKATIPGRFEAELESRGVQIAEISVEP